MTVIFICRIPFLLRLNRGYWFNSKAAVWSTVALYSCCIYYYINLLHTAGPATQSVLKSTHTIHHGRMPATTGEEIDQIKWRIHGRFSTFTTCSTHTLQFWQHNMPVWGEPQYQPLQVTSWTGFHMQTVRLPSRTLCLTLTVNTSEGSDKGRYVIRHPPCWLLEFFFFI